MKEIKIVLDEEVELRDFLSILKEIRDALKEIERCLKKIYEVV